MRGAAALVLALGLVAPCRAHQASDAFLELRAGAERIELTWWAALRDLEVEVGLDADGDGAITWGELAAREAELAGRLPGWLGFTLGGGPAGVPVPLRVDEREDGAYAVLGLVAPRPAGATRVGVGYGFLFATDPGHRVHLTVDREGTVEHRLLEPGRASAELELAAPSELARAGRAAGEGLARAAAGGPGALLALAVPVGAARAGAHPGGAVAALLLGLALGVALGAGGVLTPRPEVEAWALGLVALAYAAEALVPCFDPPARYRLAGAAGAVWGIGLGPSLAACAGAGPAGWAGVGLGIGACLTFLGALACLARTRTGANDAG